MLWAPVALAAPSGEQTPLDLDPVQPAQTAQASGGGSMLRTFIGLAVVVALIYGVYWILRQVKASREEKTSGTGLASLATLPLGPNRSLHMVRAGTEVVLIGVGEGGVTPIRTYSDLEARDAGLLDMIDADEPIDPSATAAGSNGDGNGLGRVGAQAAAPGQALEALRRWTVRR